MSYAEVMSKKQLPAKAAPRPGTWVQTDRASHEAWAALSVRNPKAGALLHVLAARVGDHNAVVVSQPALAKIMGCSKETIKRAVAELRAGGWIEVRQLGPTGSVNAYVLNDRVVWHGSRENRRYSHFSATVVVDAAEQPDQAELGNQPPLTQLPRMYPGEQQLPTGPGLPPPVEPALPGFEQDLPAPVDQRSGIDDARPIGDITKSLFDRLED